MPAAHGSLALGPTYAQSALRACDKLDLTGIAGELRFSCLCLFGWFHRKVIVTPGFDLS